MHREMASACKVKPENLRKRGQLGTQGVDKRIILGLKMDREQLSYDDVKCDLIHRLDEDPIMDFLMIMNFRVS
jgi:hypothetical protein